MGLRGSVWRKMSVAVAVSITAGALAGWWDPAGPSWIAATCAAVAALALGRVETVAFLRSADRSVAEARAAGARLPAAASSPERAQREHGGGPAAGDAGRLVQALRAMDEVRYDSGHPNVLSLTKRLHRGSEEDGTGARDATFAGGLRVTRADRGAETVLAVVGALDASTVGDARPAFDALVVEGRTLVTLDLSSLQFLDGSGAASLGRLGRRCRAYGGRVGVSGAADQPLAVLKLLQLDRVLELS